jgi:hypothetical protein
VKAGADLPELHGGGPSRTLAPAAVAGSAELARRVPEHFAGPGPVLTQAAQANSHSPGVRAGVGSGPGGYASSGVRMQLSPDEQSRSYGDYGAKGRGLLMPQTENAFRALQGGDQLGSSLPGGHEPARQTSLSDLYGSSQAALAANLNMPPRVLTDTAEASFAGMAGAAANMDVGRGGKVLGGPLVVEQSSTEPSAVGASGR